MTLIAWAAVLAEKGGSIQLTFPFHNVNIGVKLKAALKDSSQKFFNLSYSASYKKNPLKLSRKSDQGWWGKIYCRVESAGWWADRLLRNKKQHSSLKLLSTPLAHCLSGQDIIEKLAGGEHHWYSSMQVVGILLYLACWRAGAGGWSPGSWTRPDIIFAVFELFRLYQLVERNMWLQWSISCAIFSPICWGPEGLRWLRLGWMSRVQTVDCRLVATRWCSIEQLFSGRTCGTLSITDAGFIAASTTVQEVICTCSLLDRLGFPQPEHY